MAQRQTPNDPYRPKSHHHHGQINYGIGRGHFQKSYYDYNKTWMPYNDAHSLSTSEIQTSGSFNITGNTWTAAPKKSVSQHRTTLPNNVMESYLEQLQGIWQSREFIDSKSKGDAVYTRLVAILKDNTNPWETAFFLITSTSDYCHAKTASLSFLVLTQFQKWVVSTENRHHGKEDNYLTEDLRTRVFYATTGKHMPYFKTAVKAFLLDHPGNIYLLPACRALLARNKLTECAQIVCILGLQSHFSQSEILVPLLLTDKVNVIESYVMGNPEQQASILSLLDYLCSRNTDVISFAQSTGIKSVKGDKLSKKVLSKFAMKLMKLYDIPPEACPNISENRAMGAIRYLLYKRYIEKSIGYDGWDDMVESAVGNNGSLKQQLIMELLSYNDIPEAVKWADRYKLPDSSLDPSVVQAREQIRHSNNMAESETKKEMDVDDTWDELVPDTVHYQFPLPLKAVTVVDNKVKLKLCLDRITKPETVIGIDAEWKPCMGATAEQVALLQLAVCDHVFLVDIMELKNILLEDEWVTMATTIFCDDKLVKIGYGLDTDLRMIVKTLPCLKEPMSKMIRVVELEKLAKKVFTDFDAIDIKQLDENQTTVLIRKAINNDLVPKTEEKGLSLLVKNTLGKPLSKGEQMSNWERRPLRQSQISYAALDAFVLLEVYNVLIEQGKELGLSKSEIEPPVLLKMKTRMDKKKDLAASANKTRLSKARPSPTFIQSGVKSPSQFRFVCDSMLQGLGSQLRNVGIDTFILNEGQRQPDAIQLCLREDRIILTSGSAFDKIRLRVGDDMCYYVRNDVSSIFQCRDVLRHFNIKITKDDIFSRCSMCNSSDFITLPSKEMEKLYMFNSQQRKLAFGMQHDSAVSLLDIDPETQATFASYGVDPVTLKLLYNGVKVQVDTVTKEEAFSTIKEFYICSLCGKVYWVGSHFSRMCAQFDNILNLTPDEITLNPEELFDDDQEDYGGDEDPRVYDF